MYELLIVEHTHKPKLWIQNTRNYTKSEEICWRFNHEREGKIGEILEFSLIIGDDIWLSKSNRPFPMLSYCCVSILGDMVFACHFEITNRIDDDFGLMSTLAIIWVTCFEILF